MKKKMTLLLADIYIHLAARFEIAAVKYYKKHADIHIKYQTLFGKQIKAYMDKTEAGLKNQKQPPYKRL